MMSVYVAAHKKFDWFQIEGYIPIAIGKTLTEDETCLWLKDNAKENISEKNPNYCELTAQYWIWKNDRDSVIKGLCHYRRYLTRSIWSNQKKHILNQKQIETYLKKYDILLPYPDASVRGNLRAYCDCGFETDIALTRDVIRELYPEYLSCFDGVFGGTATVVGNMLITSAQIFDGYSEWLFDILFELEKRADLSGYTVQQGRIFGYISERLLSVWLMRNQLKVKYFRLLNTEEDYGIKEFFYHLLKKFGIYYLIKQIIFMSRRKG